MSAMKLLVFLLSVLAGLWLWRRGRRSGSGAGHMPARASQGTVEMVRCTYCGTHVPAHEVCAGRKGLPYCSAAHRDAGEGAA